MSLPVWVFYREQKVPAVGTVFVVESVLVDALDYSTGENVTLVTLWPMPSRSVDLVDVDDYAILPDEEGDYGHG